MTASDPHSLTLRRMLASDHPEVAELTVADEQKPFVDPMPLTLETTGLQRDNFVIETDAGIAGFFQINTRPPDYIAQPLLELCQLLIDQSQQGHGLGKRLIQCLPKVLQRE